jgi:hypothetical protein
VIIIIACRLNELLQGDGIAIVDSGINFGGGILGRYGINSNTSGQGFIKCTFKKIKRSEKEKLVEVPPMPEEVKKKKSGLKVPPLTKRPEVGQNPYQANV